MDKTDPDITFDNEGICNHCHRYKRVATQRLIPLDQREKQLGFLVAEIKAAGEGKDYDCVIGVSGGVDSTYVAYLVKQLGLRPLAIHLDNGWNSELAVANIQKTLSALNIDLYTHVIDWQEFLKLQVAFLKASTPDGEVPTDHAIFALLYELAAKHGLKHVILGTNVVSEAILPEKWGYGYFDWRYIKDVQRRFGTGKLTTYPHFSLAKLAYSVFVRRIRMVAILNYVHYDKKEAMDVLQDKLGWIYYGGKHYESIYTRFYQAYILPRKFNIDKRKAHYSNLICSGQMTREEAFTLMQDPVYPEKLLEDDREYTIKKLGLTEDEFEAIMKAPNKTFLDYKTSHGLFEHAKKIVNASRRWIG
ncbi:MAG: ExsB family protein [Burkholderiales bacterium RIFCSPLOWO2_02_FULL_57_36]|nr:MAG: ExsB family protein [Burkholderiales bacterium RIFCSPLOWO2_02_FULL_57_36]